MNNNMMSKMSYIVQQIKEYGLSSFIEHAFKKLHWSVSSRKFKCVGKGTFLEAPYTLHGENHIELGEKVVIRKRLQLEAYDSHNGVAFQPQIKIGNRVSINYDVHIGAINEIIIEDDVLIGSKVFITDHSHGRADSSDLTTVPQSRTLYSKGPVHIKKNVWIGENVAILPNVTIGKNCIIGANSVVTKSIPDNCVAAGNPARVIKNL